MKYSCCAIYMFLTLLLLIHYSSMGTDLLQNSCQKASNTDPNVNYTFCVASFESNPNTHTACTLQELAAISIEIAISNATNITCQISKLLENKDLNLYTIRCLQDCLELYSDSSSTLQDAMSDLESRDYHKTSLEVSSAMDTSGTCEDGFMEKEGEVSPLTEENRVFFQMTAISLAFIGMLRVKD